MSKNCENQDTCNIENHPYVRHLEAKIVQLERRCAEANKIIRQFDDGDFSDLDPSTQLWIANFIDSLKRTLSGKPTGDKV